MWYGKFYDMEYEIRTENIIDDIYTLCGCDKDGKILSIVTYYTDDDNAEEKNIEIDFGRKDTFEIYLLDEEHDGEFASTTDNLKLTLKATSCLLIKEI